LGGNITGAQRAAIERAATLTALAEDAQARRLAGDSSVSLEDLVRIDNAAMRAVKQLGLKPAAAPKPSLAEHLASRAGRPVAAPITPAAPCCPPPSPENASAGTPEEAA
jgi:hypothetical protein